MIRLFEHIAHERNPTNGPKEYQKDHHSHPRDPRGMSPSLSPSRALGLACGAACHASRSATESRLERVVDAVIISGLVCAGRRRDGRYKGLFQWCLCHHHLGTGSMGLFDGSVRCVDCRGGVRFFHGW